MLTLLFLCFKNGVFIVRNKEGVPSQPYSMSLLYNNEVSNLEIRKLDANKWAIGKPKETETVLFFFKMSKFNLVFNSLCFFYLSFLTLYRK